MNIRPAEPRDSPVWARLRQRLWPAAPGEHTLEIEAFFRGPLPTLAVAFLAWAEDDAAVGFAEASIRPYAEGCVPGRVAYLEGLYVEPEHRRRGVAAALVRTVEAWGRAEGCSELGSDTAIDNEVSEAMHGALGFAEVERIICFRKDL